MANAEKKRDRHPGQASEHRVKRLRGESLKPPVSAPGKPSGRRNAVHDCGWGRLLFGQTFESAEALVESIRAEEPGRRDIAFYVRDPHVLLATAPQELFLDPSHTYRLDLTTYRLPRSGPRGFFVRRLASRDDAEAVNRIYETRDMVPVHPEFFWSKRDSRAVIYFVAEDAKTGEVIGTVTGVNHSRAFDDPEAGASLWCLAVDPQARQPGIGEALVRRLAEHFKTRRALYMDLSVLHDNDLAIALYEKLGFRRVPFFALKRKNPINEKLFAGPSPEEEEALNPYARIIVDEGRRRGIGVDLIDAEGGFFRLTYGGRSIACREALSELTTAVAMSICDDKSVTRRIVGAAGVAVPAQADADDEAAVRALLATRGSVVVKPARGEQGAGVAVGLDSWEDVSEAIVRARAACPRVLVEEYVEGQDLRVIVIDFRVVAAAVRRPAAIVGDGRTHVRDLIEKQSRRRAGATGGESSIPTDSETERCLTAAGYGWDDVPDEGTEILVRKTANLHTGGTIHDVTDIMHPRIVDAAVRAAEAIDIPVTGLDFIVRSPALPDYWFIEANERPGLANHEPQPTAERFVDLLFPQSRPSEARAGRA